MNQNGSVMILALVILMASSLLGVMSLNTTSVELQIAQNDYAGKQAFYNAESGIALARATNLDTDLIPESDQYEINVYDILDEDDNPTGEIMVESIGYSPYKGHPIASTVVLEAGFVNPSDGAILDLDAIIEFFYNLIIDSPDPDVVVDAIVVHTKLLNVKDALETDPPDIEWAEDELQGSNGQITHMIANNRIEETDVSEYVNTLHVITDVFGGDTDYKMTYWRQP